MTLEVIAESVVYRDRVDVHLDVLELKAGLVVITSN